MLLSATSGVAMLGAGAVISPPEAFKALGQNPKGDRKRKILQSPQYREGQFQNQIPTVMMAEDYSFWKVSREYLKKAEGREPEKPITVFKPEYGKIHQEAGPFLTWLGHSSYILQWGGMKPFTMVVDPVLGRCSPVSFAGPRPYAGMDLFNIENLPKVIDVLLITHDHYDHLDYATVKAILPKVKRVVCSLGVGSHLAYWGYPEELITDLDWYEDSLLSNGFRLTALPARHFSGRTLNRNQTLWSSFMLEAGAEKFYLGGDSGFGPHFEEIGNKYGPFDYGLLECGQYNHAWRYIHNLPENTAEAAGLLGLKKLIPVHWGKFTLALHPWLEPPKIVKAKADELGLHVVFPIPGETMAFQHLPAQDFWWQSLV